MIEEKSQKAIRRPERDAGFWDAAGAQERTGMTLKNKLNITESAELARAEEQLSKKKGCRAI